MSDETPIKEMSFEEAMRELEAVVSKLDRGDVALEESITLYERGAALKAHCETKLKAAQEKVERIVVESGRAAGTEPAD